MDNNLQVFIEMRNSERLTFRLMDERDFGLFYDLNCNEEVMQYAYDEKIATEKEAKVKFYEILARQLDDEEGTMFVVSLSEDGAKIGIVDYLIDQVNTYGGIFDIGYFLSSDYWGHGYATEMSQAMVDYLFENYNVHKLTGRCHEDNKASESVLKKCGMTLEGVYRKSRYKDRVWKDEKQYGILRDEWEDSRK